MNIENLDETRSRRDYNRYIISYDSVLPLASDALNPAVLLETSYTAVSFPTVILPVHSYIGDMMDKEAPDSIEEFMLLPFSMKVQALTEHWPIRFLPSAIIIYKAKFRSIPDTYMIFTNFFRLFLKMKLSKILYMK